MMHFLLIISYHNSFFLDKVCNYLKCLSLATFILDGTDQGICTHQYHEKQGNSNTQAFDDSSSSEKKKTYKQQTKKEVKNRTDKKELVQRTLKNHSFLSILFFTFFFLCCLPVFFIL